MMPINNNENGFELNKFWRALGKYIQKYSECEIEPVNFIFNENIIICPELAYLLWREHCRLFDLLGDYDKECDYSRLLKKENNELLEEIEQLTEENEEDGFIEIDCSGNGYVS